MGEAQDILFAALADPTRRALFERLCRRGEQTVGALTAEAGVSQPAVSKHLGVLKRAGLVRDRHEGRQTHYSARLEALSPLVDWTKQMAGFWESRFDDLEDLLKRMDQ
ncbi:metalloregulator ArsR/SmtB family transcription factor [Mycoplana sp. MJR14]|uniref:ArsR/SmtB family transcription factor n=1 Tax=Mycoplana sp. MJR14 TaxID=3032583 RepID=UPI000DD507CD|nr:metalloregulator ArsR/SmtB family transcription factor [Mycoplana sp. MJR14]MDF1634751.1 metalloregulator ArsR/SmtB family transcription factor [Mycoplana sp. MJR14]